MTNTNNAPFFGQDTLQIAAVERDSLIIPLHVSEPDSFAGDSVGFALGEGGQPGMLLTNSDEQYSELHWYPENRHVPEVFYVQVTGEDQSNEADTLICHITVENRNSAPEIRNAISDTVEMYEDSLWSKSLTIKDPDVDIEQDTVRFTLENAPTNLTISPEYLSTINDSVFTLSWQPDNSQVVADSQFTIYFTDDSAATDTQQVSYKVRNTNDPPAFV
ncbi:MAG: hypothetical protein MAGBODY4_00060 [Candidatus Marinimicrobia bacterium]|nr:hypothetical protein [Candidatus Neomarinimicrobiota bacterium]